jgi:hypothetical protein
VHDREAPADGALRARWRRRHLLETGGQHVGRQSHAVLDLPIVAAGQVGELTARS